MPLILVVDDEPDWRAEACEVLEYRGFDAVGVADGGAALSFLSSPDPLPEAILLDLEMPGMTGWELLAELQRNRALQRIPVVIMSAHDLARSSVAGAVSDFLVKPMTDDDLVAAVENAMAGARRSAATSG